MVAGSKNLESSILKQVQHDAMWCFLNNIRQSFQTRILNLVFNLLRGFTENGEPMTVNVVFHQRSAGSLSLSIQRRLRRTVNQQRTTISSACN